MLKKWKGRQGKGREGKGKKKTREINEMGVKVRDRTGNRGMARQGKEREGMRREINIRQGKEVFSLIFKRALVWPQAFIPAKQKIHLIDDWRFSEQVVQLLLGYSISLQPHRPTADKTETLSEFYIRQLKSQSQSVYNRVCSSTLLPTNSQTPIQNLY